MQSRFESMTYQDFNKDDTAGYGIFDQLGFKYDDRLELDNDDDDDFSRKFEKLMLDRKDNFNDEYSNKHILSKKKLKQDKR